MQSISEDRVRHIATQIWETLKSSGDAQFTDNHAALETIKEAFGGYALQGKAIDETVRKKISSLQRKVQEGSSEWEILYKQYSEEEMRKRALS